MPDESLVSMANFLQSCIPLLSLSAYLPQWKKLVRTRSSHDISLRAWLIWSVSAVIAVFYAVVQYNLTGQGLALVFSSTTNLFFVFVTVYLVVNNRTSAPPGA